MSKVSRHHERALSEPVGRSTFRNVSQNRHRVPRAAKRYELNLPVATDGGEGRTRDLSADGVYFTCERGFAVGSKISFSISLDSDGSDIPLRMSCSGVVIRVESNGDEVGVAAKIESYRILP